MIGTQKRCCDALNPMPHMPPKPVLNSLATSLSNSCFDKKRYMKTYWQDMTKYYTIIIFCEIGYYLDMIKLGQNMVRSNTFAHNPSRSLRNQSWDMAAQRRLQAASDRWSSAMARSPRSNAPDEASDPSQCGNSCLGIFCGMLLHRGLALLGTNLCLVLSFQAPCLALQ